MLAYNSGTGGAIVSKFSVYPGMVLRAKVCAYLGQKFGEEVMDRGHKIGIFLFLRDLAGHVPEQADWPLRWRWTGYRCAHRRRWTICIAQMK